MDLNSINNIYSPPKIKLKLAPKSEDFCEVRRNNMFARRVKVLEYIREHGTVSPSVIAKELNISDKTVRNDIDALVEANALKKMYLGAKGLFVEYRLKNSGIRCVV